MNSYCAIITKIAPLRQETSSGIGSGMLNLLSRCHMGRVHSIYADLPRSQTPQPQSNSKLLVRLVKSLTTQ